MEFNKAAYTVKRLVDAWQNRQLSINTEYQRGAEWRLSQQQSLVDSIMRDYPIPPFFLHVIESTALDGTRVSRHEVIDGQQRIRALADFVSDKFALLAIDDKRLALPHRLRSLPAPWAGRRYSDLNPADRDRLLRKDIDVFLITRTQLPDEVRDLFIRLQSGTALSRQQVRDAWPGNIGPYIEKLAGKLDRQPSRKLFRQIDKRGTGSDDDTDAFDSDRQFCGQLLCLFLARENNPSAVQSVSANDLDRLYHERTEFAADGETAQRFENCLRIVEETIGLASGPASGSSRTKKKFKKLDVIAAFMLTQDLTKDRYFRPDPRFKKAVAERINANLKAPGKSNSGRTIAEYYSSWRGGIVEPLGIQTDPKRIFDEREKAEIYKRDNGICQIGNHPVETGEDEYDHFPLAHALGGRTEVSNGRLVCKKCHPRGPLRADTGG